MDEDGNFCLTETFDGHKAVKKIGREEFLGLTNHAFVPEINKSTE